MVAYERSEVTPVSPYRFHDDIEVYPNIFNKKITSIQIFAGAF